MEFEEDKMINDPGNYKWGIFYYNQQDSRTIVPKRAQWMGWTLNFASPGAYLIIATLVACIVLSSFLG